MIQELAVKLQEKLQNIYAFDATGSTVHLAIQALNAIEEVLSEAVNSETEACARIADKESKVYRKSSSTLENMGTVAAERIGAAIRTRKRKLQP